MRHRVCASCTSSRAEPSTTATNESPGCSVGGGLPTGQETKAATAPLAHFVARSRPRTRRFEDRASRTTMRVGRSEPLMDAAPSHTGPEGDAVSARERLESWKEIAVYLKTQCPNASSVGKGRGAANPSAAPQGPRLRIRLQERAGYLGPVAQRPYGASKATSRSEPRQRVGE